MARLTTPFDDALPLPCGIIGSAPGADTSTAPGATITAPAVAFTGGNLCDAQPVDSLIGPARVEIISPGATAIAIRVSGIGARCVCPVMGAPVVGVFEQVKLMMNVLRHVMKHGGETRLCGQQRMWKR